MMLKEVFQTFVIFLNYSWILKFQFTCPRSLNRREVITQNGNQTNIRKKRSVITFEKARLILVDKTSSYVELNSPDDFATRVNTVSRSNTEQ